MIRMIKTAPVRRAARSAHSGIYIRKKNILRFVLSFFLLLPHAVLAFHLYFFTIFGARILELRENTPAVTSLMLIRMRETGGEYPPPSFIPLSQFPADLVRTVLFAEDGYFFRHWGISLEYIEHAIRINRRLGYPAYGASTVTQQLARTLFFSLEKSYVRKYFEILAALELEVFLSKDRILELYLNYCELGPGIFGFNDAAAYYFGKTPQKLGIEEKLALVAIMPGPLQFTPYTFRESEVLWRRYVSIRRYYEIERRMPPRFESTIIEKPDE